ncbi:LysR family transcriptional regulator [Morganella morganii]|nr:LysR family transcriptional regulator [Morganella morganii]
MDIYRYAENLSFFVEVARNGSFSAVARRHGVYPSSVMRKIDMLEEVMKAPLFVRSTKGIHLTEAGNVVFNRAVHILKSLNDVRNEVFALNEELVGTLCISCLPTFAKLHIFPWLSEFKFRYPEVNLVLDLSEKFEISSTEHPDAAIRIGKLKNSSLYRTKIAQQKWIACASPRYLELYGFPCDPDNLHGHHILDKYYDPHSISWGRIIDTQRAEYRLYMRCNDFDALQKAAVSGLGIVFLPDWVVGHDIKSGKLVKVFDDPQQKIDDIYFLRTLPKMSPKLTVFLQFLRNNLLSVI